MPLAPETPPSPMPGAKSSAPDKGDPRADTDNNSNAGKTIKLTPEQHAEAVRHTTTMADVLGIGKAKDVGVGPEGKALDAMNKGIDSAPSTAEE